MYKREPQTANLTARHWSRDVLKFGENAENLPSLKSFQIIACSTSHIQCKSFHLYIPICEENKKLTAGFSALMPELEKSIWFLSGLGSGLYGKF